MVESFPITSCTKGWVWCTCTCSSAPNIGWTCPRRLSHRKHVYLFIFLFSCTKIWSLLIQPGEDENAFKWADNFNTKHLHFLHKCSFRLRKKASFWSTYRAKQTTNKRFLIEGRKESHECCFFFSILHFAQLAWQIKGKTRTSRESMTCWGQRSQTLDTG